MGIPLLGIQQAIHRPTPREASTEESFLVQLQLHLSFEMSLSIHSRPSPTSSLVLLGYSETV